MLGGPGRLAQHVVLYSMPGIATGHQLESTIDGPVTWTLDAFHLR